MAAQLAYLGILVIGSDFKWAHALSQADMLSMQEKDSISFTFFCNLQMFPS